jgi:hypothetical protein
MTSSSDARACTLVQHQTAAHRAVAVAVSTHAGSLQGRGPNTQAYTHSLETGHHMFMKVEDGCVYCLPDMYQVVDRSVGDIQYVLNPTFTGEKGRGLGCCWSAFLGPVSFLSCHSPLLLATMLGPSCCCCAIPPCRLPAVI